MKYRNFLLDLDDTLLDFRASEQLSFVRTLSSFGIGAEVERLFIDYQRENLSLWADFEKGLVTKDALKVERFRRTFALHGIEVDPSKASALYLDCLPQTVVLVDGAIEFCEALAAVGEVGIITNGIEHVQARRVASSGFAGALAFIATSEASGYAKPDSRFFDYCASKFRCFEKAQTVIVGDRLDADILGANQYGIDSCWLNPGDAANASAAVPTYVAASLQEAAMRLGVQS
ncbi:YjjG family noncanonical pyrimidine nucleotidase [Roseateles violae]|uniref:YjjG family noncanonical pyrimidine nucleotidase n=1 Tax=Roseateles violae TaxID=3058042 RepID=A0ABT8DQQ3_9BURK|nr:YjjG family noncanonical pyrimidine nucleotidase [Pelomonas sp. PFR6]MDN3920348.1 YjjG family noncanonical pyrimidine nucleotidase [Pelomonas sp. PFR6]